MKRLITALLSCVVLLLGSCATSRSTVATNVDLSRYEYVSVINNDTYRIPAELMPYDVQLFDAVECSRLKMVNDMRIFELSPQQQERLLMAKYGIGRNQQNDAVVTVNFIDYNSGRPVASCSGVYGFGLTPKGDLEGAIKRLAKQIANTFSLQKNRK